MMGRTVKKNEQMIKKGVETMSRPPQRDIFPLETIYQLLIATP